MKGVTVAAVGGTYDLVDDLEKPTPGKGQVLVKSLYSGLNPVENFMQGSGTLVTTWPIVLGCDASGEVVELGESVTKFKVGDGIYGCTRLGIPGYATFQEYHLFDEDLAFKRPANISKERAATLGVGILTASLGVFGGLQIPFPGSNTTPKDEWIVILGGSGSIGQYAIQLATLSGYKVLASSSPALSSICTSHGAASTFNHHLPLSAQLTAISITTSGNFTRLLDCSASSFAPAMEMLQKASTVSGKPKHFASTDDWSPMEAPEGSGIEIYRIRLGQIGRVGMREEYATGLDEEMRATDKVVRGAVEALSPLVAEGRIRPMEVVVLGEGLETVGKSVAKMGGLGGKKGVVKIAVD